MLVWRTRPRRAGEQLAVQILRSTPLELEVKKRAPEAAGAMRKISEDARTDRGWALARLGDGGWWPAVERGLRHGTFEDDVIAGLAERDPWRPRHVSETELAGTPTSDHPASCAEQLFGALVPALRLVRRALDRCRGGILVFVHPARQD